MAEFIESSEYNESEPASKRGFAAMDPDRQREISRKGGETSRGGGRKSTSQQRGFDAMAHDDRREINARKKEQASRNDSSGKV